MNTSDTSPIVVKVGGAVLSDPAARGTFWKGVRQLSQSGPVVVVHGGGQRATALAERLEHQPQFVQGRRVTTDLDLDIAKWSLRGALNTELVAEAQQHDLVAVGLSGADGGLVQVEKRPLWAIDGKEVDFGWVGDVTKVQLRALQGLLQAGLMPIVAPLGIDEDGQVYNVNADTVAQEIAGALSASQLLFVAAAGGVRHDADDPASHLPVCDRATFEAGMEAGWIAGGMRVKLRAGLQAYRAGVEEVLILGPGDLATREQATCVTD